MPVIGSDADAFNICLPTPTLIWSTCFLFFNGNLYLKYVATSDATVGITIVTTWQYLAIAGGCRWTRPLIGGTCPKTFNSANGIAAAGMAQIFGKNDLNIVYVASCSV